MERLLVGRDEMRAVGHVMMVNSAINRSLPTQATTDRKARAFQSRRTLHSQARASMS
jgi:hypothetical protein